MKSKANTKQPIFLEPGIIDGETKEEAVDRLVKVLESKGFEITNKKEKDTAKNAK